jgi:hypothetical protein
MSSKKQKPFPLAGTLRDLALIRASDVNLESVVSDSHLSQSVEGLDEEVKRSYQFVNEAKTAVKIHYSRVVDAEGDKIEAGRVKLEELITGLEAC